MKPKNIDKKEVAEAFKDNPSIAVGEDGTIYYCPDPPYRRDSCLCPEDVSKANPSKGSDPRHVAEKSPPTERLRKVFKDDNVKKADDGTVMYCREKSKSENK